MLMHVGRLGVGVALLLAPALPVGADIASPGQTVLASRDSDGKQLGGYAFGPAVSANGRFVGFSTEVSASFQDGNDTTDVYIRDLVLDTTRLVSVGLDGYAIWDADSGLPSISGNGRYVAFESNGIGFVPGQVDSGVYRARVYVRDMVTGVTELISKGWDGSDVNGSSGDAKITEDGRWVVFASSAGNLVKNDTNGKTSDVFLFDRQTKKMRLVSRASDGTQASNGAWSASVSADGSRVAFVSGARDFAPGDTNGTLDIFVRDRVAGTTIRAMDVDGSQFDAPSGQADLSADGSVVVFYNSLGGTGRVYLTEVDTGTTEIVSLAVSGKPEFGWRPKVSGDGRYVAFTSDGRDFTTMSHLPVGYQAYVRDRLLGLNEMISVDQLGRPGDYWTNWVAMSPNGRYVVMASQANNLVYGDTNRGGDDIFLRDREVCMLPVCPVPNL